MCATPLISMPCSPSLPLLDVGEREANAAQLQLLAPRAHVGWNRQRNLDEPFGGLVGGGREADLAAVETDRPAVCAAHPQKLGPAGGDGGRVGDRERHSLQASG